MSKVKSVWQGILAHNQPPTLPGWLEHPWDVCGAPCFATVRNIWNDTVDVFVGAAHPLRMEELRSCKIANEYGPRHVSFESDKIYVWHVFEMHSTSSRECSQLKRSEDCRACFTPKLEKYTNQNNVVTKTESWFIWFLWIFASHSDIQKFASCSPKSANHFMLHFMLSKMLSDNHTDHTHLKLLYQALVCGHEPETCGVLSLEKGGLRYIGISYFEINLYTCEHQLWTRMLKYGILTCEWKKIWAAQQHFAARIWAACNWQWSCSFLFAWVLTSAWWAQSTIDIYKTPPWNVGCETWSWSCW